MAELLTNIGPEGRELDSIYESYLDDRIRVISKKPLVGIPIRTEIDLADGRLVTVNRDNPFDANGRALEWDQIRYKSIVVSKGEDTLGTIDILDNNPIVLGKGRIYPLSINGRLLYAGIFGELDARLDLGIADLILNHELSHDKGYEPGSHAFGFGVRPSYTLPTAIAVMVPGYSETNTPKHLFENGGNAEYRDE